MTHPPRAVASASASPTSSLVARTLARALLAATIAACGASTGDDAPDAAGRAGGPAPSSASPAPAVSGSSSAGGAGDGCRLSGLWQRCSAIESVERAGYRLELLRDSVAQPGLATRGAAYRLGSAELQLYLFADSAAAAAGAASIETDDAEPAEVRGIRRAPAVIRTNNLVALLFDNNDRLRERVQLALAAGLPPG